MVEWLVVQVVGVLVVGLREQIAFAVDAIEVTISAVPDRFGDSAREPPWSHHPCLFEPRTHAHGVFVRSWCTAVQYSRAVRVLDGWWTTRLEVMAGEIVLI
jgi:hypothetical protein